MSDVDLQGGINTESQFGPVWSPVSEVFCQLAFEETWATYVI